MSDEELSELQDELAEARAELDALRTTAADREARAAHLDAQLVALREELAGALADGEARAQELTATTDRVDALDGQVRSSAVRYRELLLQHAPELPEELVAGETVEAIDESLSRARDGSEGARAPRIAGAGVARAGWRATALGATPHGA